VRDRYLFSADRTSSEYRTILEITAGHARLVTPSAAARMVRWVVSLFLYVAYTGLAGIFLVFSLVLVTSWTPAWVATLLFAILWFGGFLALFFWWDRRSLPLLADTPAQAVELLLLGARSFGTFQEVRARTMRGEEMKLVVDVRAPRFWEAVKLLEGRPAAFG